MDDTEIDVGASCVENVALLRDKTEGAFESCEVEGKKRNGK